MQQQVTVLSGEMHLRIDGAEHVVGAGESATIPPGAPHFQWNASDAAIVAIEEVRPAKRLHEFFAVLFDLARDGDTDARGRPSLLVAAVLFAEFRDSIRDASLATRLMLNALVPIAAALGYRRRLARYLRPSGTRA